MYPPHLTYLKDNDVVWFNPCAGIVEFWTEFDKLKNKLKNPTFNDVWYHRDFKSIKEIYASCIVAKNMDLVGESENKWWVAKTKQDPPDGVIGTLVHNGKLSDMHVREIEVVEHISGEIIDTIRNKLEKKRYEENTVLVCFLSGGSGIFDFESLSKSICNEFTSLKHIFLVFHGGPLSEVEIDAKDKDTFLESIMMISLVQLKPVFAISFIRTKIDCKDCLEGKEYMFFIKGPSNKREGSQIYLENPPRIYQNLKK